MHALKSSSSALKRIARAYWSENPNALSKGRAEPGTERFYQDVASHRYAAEPCILELADFPSARGKRVVEVGCGMGIDLRRFAEAGASVVGVDFSAGALPIARRHLKSGKLDGEVLMGDGERLPLRDGSVDLLWSHGVIHHSPDPASAVAEFHRVLRPGGTAVVMVYHKNSYLYRALVPLAVQPAVRADLALRGSPFGDRVRRVLPDRIRRMGDALASTGYAPAKVYALSTDLAYARENNHNPLSLFFSREEATRLFAAFSEVRTEVRQIYHFPSPRRIQEAVARRFGGFLYVIARK